MNYRDIESFDEIKPGFKCQSCFWYFNSESPEEVWVDVEFTEKLYNHTIGLIKADAYESEFRVEK